MQEKQEQEVATPENSGETDVKALLDTVEQLKSTNERLLQESQKHKTKRTDFEKLQEELEQYKTKELEAKGSYEEMLQMEREKVAKFQQEIKQRDERLMKSNIINTVSKYAKDAHDINDLLAQRDYASKIEIDEDSLEPTTESVKNFVESLRNEKKYLFKGNKVASMGDTRPNIEKPQNKNINDLGKSELDMLLAQSIAQLPTRK